MDGVLIDVSRSYRDTVRQTAALFFEPADGSDRLPQPMFRLADLAAVKQSGGLNNDWDLTYRVIDLLFRQVTAEPAAGEDNWQRYRLTMGACDVRPLAQFLARTLQPLATLHRQYSEERHPFIASLCEGEVGRGNVVKQMFQEIYLGKSLYEATYNDACEAYRGEGLIQRETPFVPAAVIAGLSRRYLLAVATGRPRSEAEHPLRRFGLQTYFQTVYTLDDCLAEEERIRRRTGKRVSLSKPHPFMLDAVAAAVGDAVKQRFYVGDMPDDMLAAKNSRAGYTAIGMVVSAADKAALRDRLLQAGATAVVNDFDELQQTLDRLVDRDQTP
jgi:phosphoglycolate phosphatase-like HAD superfamily hydrolase